MIDLLIERLQMVNIQVFLVSMVLFFSGYALAPIIHHKNIRWLTAYPLWIAAKLELWAHKKWNPYLLFFFIFSVNLSSISLSFIAGLVPVLPVLFALWTGLNVGVVTYHTLKGSYYFVSLLNPVALFELPAAFIAFALALQYNMYVMQLNLLHFPESLFSAYLSLFMITVIPLLFVAGILETALIIFSQRLENHDGHE